MSASLIPHDWADYHEAHRIIKLVMQHTECTSGSSTSTRPLIFEVTGARGWKADEQFRQWCKEAAESVRKKGGLNYRSRGRDHTWNALKFANLYSQLLSFSIVRDTALSAMKAVERAARLQTID